MKTDPVLARTILPADPDKGQKYPHVFTVEGGLHYLKGNSSPYFSLTYTEHRQGFPNQEESGGAGHAEILRHFPEFADLAALHLSHLDGAPMHAESNGWYKLAGALGGFGETYHAGNSKRNFPLPASSIDPAKPYITTEYRLPTPAECLAVFARHCRITPEAARAVMAEVTAPSEKINSLGAFVMVDPSPAEARTRWAAICDTMRPRWKREADACILRHALTLYGDPWDGDRPPGLRLPGEAMPRTCHNLLPGDSFSESAPAFEEDSPHGSTCAQRVISAAECTCGKADALADSPAESTYIEAWKITSTATQTDHNPNMEDARGDMSHWRVTLKRGRAKMTVYYSMGSAHNGKAPTAGEVVDCIAEDAAGIDGSSSSFED